MQTNPQNNTFIQYPITGAADSRVDTLSTGIDIQTEVAATNNLLI